MPTILYLQLADTARARADSVTRAELDAVLAAGKLPVPLRVVEVRDVPADTVLLSGMGILLVGLAIGFLLGAWWRGRRA